MRSRVFAALALAAVPVAGCYRVVPLASPTPSPGQRVILSLSSPIEFLLVEARLQNIMRVEGTVVTAGSDSLAVSASVVWSGAGTRHPALGAMVTVPTIYVREVQQKRPAVGRSLLLAAGGVGAVIAGIALVDAIGGNPGGGEPPPKQQ